MGRRRCCCDMPPRPVYSSQSYSSAGSGVAGATCGCCSPVTNLVPAELILTISGVTDGAGASGCTALNGTYYIPFVGNAASGGTGYCLWDLTLPAPFNRIDCPPPGLSLSDAFISNFYIFWGCGSYVMAGINTVGSFYHWWDASVFPSDILCCSSGPKTLTLNPRSPGCCNFAGSTAVINKQACA